MDRRRAARNRISQLEIKLLRKKAQLEQEVAGYLDDLRQASTDHFSESGDSALDALGDQEIADIVEMRALELKQVAEALERIKDKGFGTCEGCGRNISLTRLAVLPATPYCTHCQDEVERQARGEEHYAENWECVTEPEPE